MEGINCHLRLSYLSRHLDTCIDDEFIVKEKRTMIGKAILQLFWKTMQGDI
jgi:hypothetical protein